jgi:hypothetical protein
VATSTDENRHFPLRGRAPKKELAMFEQVDPSLVGWGIMLFVVPVVARTIYFSIVVEREARAAAAVMTKLKHDMMLAADHLARKVEGR